DDAYDDDFLEDEVKHNVVPLGDAKASRRVGVSVFHPRRYDEVTEMGDSLRSRHLVMVNLIGADRAMSQRVVDFLSGVVYTLDGKMQRIAEGIYLFVPANVQINAKEDLDDVAVGM
ncbi:MAG TPA: cell division protein SepF, partial [Candidatus Eremiobacteraceae bacterium]|nr:cell division protein SepF [Candidatus Eremiobacteraceae bacterium]